jgi:predicted transposase YdaD
MKTDPSIYTFLATDPEAFRVLTGGLTLAQILECWLFERFRSLTDEEIWTMMNIFTPLEETRAYQSIARRRKPAG